MKSKELKRMKSEILYLEYLTLNNSNTTKNLDNLIALKMEYGRALREYIKKE